MAWRTGSNTTSEATYVNAPRRQSWVWAALLVAGVYALVGITFAIPTTHVRVWRLAAWAVSAVAYALHIGFEHLRLRHRSLSVALHVALAVALGAFGLSVGAVVHRLSAGMATAPFQLVAFGLLPIVTGVAAFPVTLVASALLARLVPRP